jgi:hypothetical protein
LGARQAGGGGQDKLKLAVAEAHHARRHQFGESSDNVGIDSQDRGSVRRMLRVNVADDRELFRHSLAYDSPQAERLRDAAKRNNVFVVMGLALTGDLFLLIEAHACATFYEIRISGALLRAVCPRGHSKTPLIVIFKAGLPPRCLRDPTFSHIRAVCGCVVILHSACGVRIAFLWARR